MEWKQKSTADHTLRVNVELGTELASRADDPPAVNIASSSQGTGSNLKKMNISRRELVKGGLAAPLVLTLRHASAQAQTSLSCLQKSMSQAQISPPPKWANSADSWLRKSVKIYKLQRWDDKKKKWEWLAGGKYLFYFPSNNTRQYNQLNAEIPFDTGSMVTNPALTPSNTTQGPYITRQAIVYVDSKGAEVGFAWEKPAQSFVTSQSCATSTALRAR